MSRITPITPSLWYDTEAEDVARLYTTVFPHSENSATSHYTEVGADAMNAMMGMKKPDIAALERAGSA